MNKVKKEHTVPISYLERFCIHNQPGVIYCYDKITKKSFTRNIKNVAFSKYFYDLKPGDDQIIEKQFSKREGKWKTAISSLIKKGDPKKLSMVQRELIFEFVSAQLVRTFEKRSHLLELFNFLYPIENTPFNQEDYNEFVKHFHETGVKVSHHQIINNIKEYNSIISNYNIYLGINKTLIPLKTSDNPVNTNNLNKENNGKKHGLKNDDIELYIALDPFNILMISNPITHEREESAIFLNEENVIERNIHQTMDCTRQIFSSINNFEKEKQFLTEWPKYFDENRIRRNYK